MPIASLASSARRRCSPRSTIPTSPRSTGSKTAAARTRWSLELVEGETLGDRIARGPIAIDEALPIARQIAEALEAAHEHGIIHRDLKPANIKITPDGVVKVLDFGLAKLNEPNGSNVPNGLSMSPTITSPALMTGVGMILGTAAYMSPEQARGKPVDRRADIWAFGAVLYEMLTGRRAFEDEDVSLTLSKVLQRDPDWSVLLPDVPPRVRQVLRICLEKDPKRRAQAMGDVRLALDGAFETAVSQAAAPVVVPRRRRTAVLAAGALGVAVMTGAFVYVATRPEAPRVLRFSLAPRATAALTVSGINRDLAITPDGSRIAYVGDRGTQLFVQALDTFEPAAVFTGAPRGLFASPDGQWIGFVDTNNVLKKVTVTGGPPVTVATLDGGSRGAMWTRDDAIIFATLNATTGLQRVAAGGGSTTVLTRPDRARGEADHVWPEMLPGGGALLFTITSLSGGIDAAQVAVLDLQTGTRKVVLRGGSHAHYVPSGHLVYAAAGTLRMVRFDLAALETIGTPVPVVSDVVTTQSGGLDAVVAGDGTLVYVSGGGPARDTQFVWRDRSGARMGTAGERAAYTSFDLSSDEGSILATRAETDGTGLFLIDASRGTATRILTPQAVQDPVWSPDGRRFAWKSGTRVIEQPIFGGTARVVIDDTAIAGIEDWSPDGKQLLVQRSESLERHVLAVPLTGGTPVSLAKAASQLVDEPRLSLDGRWIVYNSDDSGRLEVYVGPVPSTGERWPVSTGGGVQGRWRGDGRALYYLTLDGTLMAVDFAAGDPPRIGAAKRLFDTGLQPTYNLDHFEASRDGKRFLIREPVGDTAQRLLNVVLNWTASLEK